MSQHPSLRVDSVGAQHRNVLKRFERIKKLKEQNKWVDRQTIFGLPKVKSLKIKVKKIKEEAKEGAAAVPGQAAAATPAAAAPAGKATIPAKAAVPAKAAAPSPKAAPAAAKTEKAKK